MKSRNSSSLHRLSIKRTDSENKDISQRNRKRPASSAFRQRSAQIIQTYGALLRKTPQQFGDAEAYFKQTLRNYDEFDFKSLKAETNKDLKGIKSWDFIKTDRKRHIGSGDNKERAKKASQKKPQTPAAKKEETKAEEDDEPDLEVFYSPSSYLTGDNSNSVIMAEEDETPVGTDFAEEDEEAEDDVLEETEELVKNASKEIDQMEEENKIPGGEEMQPEEVPPPAEEASLEGPPVPEPENPQIEGEETAPPPPPEEKEEIEEKPKEPTKQPSKIKTPQGSLTFPPPEAKPKLELCHPDGRAQDTILKEVAECETQCTEISTILVELRKRVTTLLSKPTRSPDEDKELEDKQKQLNDKMHLLEQKTRRLEMLMNQTRAQSYDQPQTEDSLPKVIICGITENNMPKIIVCDGKKKKKPGPKLGLPPQQQLEKTCPPCIPPGAMPHFVQRLSESYNMQERLACENADLEGKRYQLQEDLLDKDQTVESLQRKLTGLQTEMRMIVKENNLLNDKLEKAQQPPTSCHRGDTPKGRKKMPCGRGRGICPADVEGRLNEYSETTQQLEKQLADMEDEVKTMQSELVAVRQERMHLEQHRRMMSCPNTCPPTAQSCHPMSCGIPPCPNAPPPCGGTPCGGPPPCAFAPPCQRPSPCPTCCPAPCNPNRPCGPSPEQQLRELREKYTILQDDYKGKLTEVAGLRAEVDKLKENASELDQSKKLAEEKSKECAKLLKECRETKKIVSGSKEQNTELEQQLAVAKQRYREVKDELEEVRALVEEHRAQMDEYRNKYMQAQQTVEEQRRQIDMMELENSRIGEQVNLEIQRVKNQFQEKLQELTPLPDILKATQKKLQEVQQMHLLAERKNEVLLKDLQACRDKAAELEIELEKMRGNEMDGAGEAGLMQQRYADSESTCKELLEENERLKDEMAALQEALDESERQLKEKLHEIAQLSAEVENVREESARQIARTKDRCETIRRSMQLQITELERQLACCRALTRAAQKDRDEIRQKMQSQINNLNENFEDAQMRIRNLQGHVNFLKHSYTNVVPPVDACNCGNDSAPGDGVGATQFNMGDPGNRCPKF